MVKDAWFNKPIKVFWLLKQTGIILHNKFLSNKKVGTKQMTIESKFH